MQKKGIEKKRIEKIEMEGKNREEKSGNDALLFRLRFGPLPTILSSFCTRARQSLDYYESMESLK